MTASPADLSFEKMARLSFCDKCFAEYERRKQLPKPHYLEYLCDRCLDKTANWIFPACDEG